MFIGMHYLPGEVDVVMLAKICFKQICPKLYLIVLFGIPGDDGGRESQRLFTVDAKTKLIPVNIKTAIELSLIPTYMFRYIILMRSSLSVFGLYASRSQSTLFSLLLLLIFFSSVSTGRKETMAFGPVVVEGTVSTILLSQSLQMSK
jgi:hypothetical protein